MEEMNHAEFKGDWEAFYIRRYNKHIDELKWLYMELYENEGMFSELCYQMHQFFTERSEDLKNRDMVRENHPDWMSSLRMTGMSIDTDNFAGSFKGLEQNMEYLQKCPVDLVCLNPFFAIDTKQPDDDRAVVDFRHPRPELGTIDDFYHFVKQCHHNEINVCIDFVMAHTSDEHEWARKARQGDAEYQSRYYFTDHPEKSSAFWNQPENPSVFWNQPENRKQYVRVEETGRFVLTVGSKHRWSLNYRNPRVFHEMIYHFLFLANHGVDVLKIPDLPMIRSGLAGEGSDWPDHPVVHNILRLMRLISEIVCPGLLLAGDQKLTILETVPYFGDYPKDELHLVVHHFLSDEIWNAVATRNIRLLKYYLDQTGKLRKKGLTLHYLRNREPLAWHLNYDYLKKHLEIDETMHREYLNGYFQGITGYSPSRGILVKGVKPDGVTGFFSTTASMCGLEAAIIEHREDKIEDAIRLELMLYAFLFMQPGIPVIQSGDEIGLVRNREACEEKEAGWNSGTDVPFDWGKAARIVDEYSIEGKILRGLSKLEIIRKREAAFDPVADFGTIESGKESVICLYREFGEEKILGIFNFSEYEQRIHLPGEEGTYEELITGRKMRIGQIRIDGHDFLYIKKCRFGKDI